MAEAMETEIINKILKVMHRFRKKPCVLQITFEQYNVVVWSESLLLQKIAKYFNFIL